MCGRPYEWRQLVQMAKYVHYQIELILTKKKTNFTIFISYSFCIFADTRFHKFFYRNFWSKAITTFLIASVRLEGKWEHFQIQTCPKQENPYLKNIRVL